MVRVRTALYLDFDNVFGGLLKLDPEVAIEFAQNPGSWLSRLSTSLPVEGPRRWLILRCYMNPAGSVPNPDSRAGATRLYFSSFRPFFTNAGFEVIDCPRLTHTKNAADIRMVVDAVDALAATPTYEEFVIASGDSDMTPLLVRLRAADRRTTIVSPSDAAEAFTAIADRLFDSQQLLQLVQGEQVEVEDEAAVPAEVTGVRGDSEGFERFRELVAAKYAETNAPLNLASLAHELRRELGPTVDDSGWFGYGGFVKALESLELPGVRFSQHFVWEDGRHQAPDLIESTGGESTTPEPVTRLTALLNLPRLPKESWPAVYKGLSDYANSHHFNLTEATRWSRDHLAEQGVDVSRNAIGFVTRGASFGGCPLYRQPSPTAAEVGAAFVENVLSRADAAAITLSPEEVTEVRSWLGVPQPAVVS